jgi:hypothetical protein
MKIEELTTIKVTPPTSKKRDKMNYWNLASRKKLKLAIQKCLDTGEQQLYFGDMDLFVIKPRFPLIESAMQKPENVDLLKVSVIVYHLAFHLAVRSGDIEIDPITNFGGEEEITVECAQGISQLAN